MGLFDAIAGQVAGGLSSAGGGKQAGLLAAAMELIGNSQAGGLQGLVSAFQQKGLGDLVASWVGTGQNLPLAPQQLESVVGRERIESIAQKAGLSPKEASAGLADLLPQAIDKLTPAGNLPAGGVPENMSGLLQGLFK